MTKIMKMKIMKFISFVCFRPFVVFMLFGMFFYTNFVYASDGVIAFPMTASFSSDITKTDVKTGDIVSLTLNAKLPKDARLPQNLKLSGADNLIVVDMKALNEESVELKLLINSIDTFEVPSLGLTFFDKEFNEHHLKSNPVSLNLKSEINETNVDLKELAPIKTIVKMSGIGKHLYSISIIALLIFLALSVWFLIKKRKRYLEEIARSAPAHEIAFNALREIRDNPLYEQAGIKSFYFRLSQIAKEYMGAIRTFPAAELTTEELSLVVTIESDRELVRVLRKADMIKFADFRPTISDKQSHWEQVWKYVAETSAPIQEQQVTISK